MAEAHFANGNEERVARALDRAGLSYVHSARVGPYEVDFRLGQKVIVEVDGYTHLTNDNRRRDQNKDRYLSEIGYTVLRITGQQVNSPELERFIERVRAALKAERARAEQDRPSNPFADPRLAELRDRLAQKEAQGAPTARPTMAAPRDDSELFLAWVGEAVRPPRKKDR